MENQKKPLLIRSCRTPKTIPVIFHVTFQKFCTIFTKQPKIIEMGHGCIHLSLALTFAQFCGTFNRFL